MAQKVAVITGGSKGIGFTIAQQFAKNGYNLIITGRREDRLQEMKTTLEKNHSVKVLTLCFDVRDEKQVEAAVKSITGDFKMIDVLVNNAGLAAGLSAIQDGKLAHWEQMIDTNIKGLLYMTKCISKIMIANKKVTL